MNIGLREAKLNFELKKNIGAEGKNSDVFIAHDKQFDADIVIKRIPKKDFKSPNDYYKEAKCLYASKHQNIVSVNYSCEDDEHIYIAMPHYGNGSLESLTNTRFLTVREVLKYSIDFLSGLNHIHTKGLIHFDIKPTNILISDSNEALVTDFGLAKFTNIHSVAEQDRFYSLHTAPECLLTNKFTIQVDIYHAGLTLYRICNGSGVFKNQLIGVKNKAELDSLISNGKFPDRQFFLPHIPQKLRNVIRKALSLNPVDRHNNLIEFLNELSKIQENLDWQLTGIPNGNKWVLDQDNKTYDISLKQDNGSFNIEAFKTMKDSGNTTRIKDNFRSNLSIDKATIELKKILKSY
ncbi:serine/threonine-protein kinase [Aureibaculum luteum]|uniref:serine/threonine-protein kinase n=1 Tax=Aureibaculum luteum TaxID=1548456 RepID=UPI000E477A24|nr:serine/threonine-protein kinase [Aureibaculum luteum]